jgi:putative endonuclease
MTYSCYILYSKKLDRYYLGHTDDITRRLQDHNAGISSFTSKADDWIVVYVEAFENREQARKREFELKKKKSRKYLEWLIMSKKD